jgi:transposase/transposase-like protein
MADARLEPVVLSADERRTLENWVRRRSTAQGLALRARIVLACADGGSNVAVAAQLGVNHKTVSRWRSRFLRKRLDGLTDDPRPGVPRTITDAQVEEVVVRTLEEVPRGRHPLVEAGAGPPGGHLAVQRGADLAGLRPAALAHRDVQDLPGPAADRQDPGRRRPVPGPAGERGRAQRGREAADNQALERTAPVLPMLPGVPERRSFDYERHGTTDLFAALNIATGKVISKLSAQHTAADFRDFLDQIDRVVEPGPEVHVICDNLSAHKAPAVHRWLLAHPRFVLHFTPTYSSWINQVERWFAEIQRRCLDRGVFCSLEELTTGLEEWIKIWNDSAKPSKWTKTPDQIIDAICRYCDRISRPAH